MRSLPFWPHLCKDCRFGLVQDADKRLSRIRHTQFFRQAVVAEQVDKASQNQQVVALAIRRNRNHKDHIHQLAVRCAPVQPAGKGQRGQPKRGNARIAGMRDGKPFPNVGGAARAFTLMEAPLYPFCP